MVLSLLAVSVAVTAGPGLVGALLVGVVYAKALAYAGPSGPRRLIGVNAAIYSPSGAYAGIGFAIPVDTVQRVVPQIIRTGRVATMTVGIVVNDRIGQVITRRIGVEGKNE